MTTLTRAWKDPTYRAQLSPVELAALGTNPAGTIDIADTGLDRVVGASTWNQPCITAATCLGGTCGATQNIQCGNTITEACAITIRGICP